MEDLFLARPSRVYQKSFENYALSYAEINDDYYFDKYKRALNCFEGYLQDLKNLQAGVGLPQDEIQTSNYWLIDRGEVAGVVRIRHRPDEFAGHIGYDISPRYRKKGYGTQILRLALKKAAELGLDEVIVTCNTGNTASKKIIEKNGGQYLGVIFDPEENEELYRYRIQTAI